MRRFSLALLIVLPLSAARTAAQDVAPLNPNSLLPTPLHMAVIRYMQSGDSQDTSDFATATSDLNGDGIDDAVVIARGLTWCGTGGCTMLVFRGTTSGFRFVSRSTVTETPIRVSPTKSNGWRTLIVHTRDKGDVLMRFDGKAYPLNPSLQRAASPAQTDGARVLLNGR